MRRFAVILGLVVCAVLASGSDGTADQSTGQILAASCSPRPNVVITRERHGTGVRFSVQAGNGLIRQLRFWDDQQRPGSPTNAVIDIEGGPSNIRGRFTYNLPTPRPSVAFMVHQATSGAPVQIPLVVVDGCNDWRTFVGGGTGAFIPTTSTATPTPTIGTPTATPTPTPAGPRPACVDSPAGSVPFGERAYSPDGRSFAQEVEPRNMSRVGIFRADTGAPVRVVQLPDGANDLKGLCWSNSSSLLAAAYHQASGARIYVVYARSGQLARTIPTARHYHQMRFSPDDSDILAEGDVIPIPPFPPTGGLHVAGNQIATWTGQAIRLLGVNRSGTEYMCVEGRGITDGEVDDAAIRAMKSWNVNVVRLPLNAHCWRDVTTDQHYTAVFVNLDPQAEEGSGAVLQVVARGGRSVAGQPAGSSLVKTAVKPRTTGRITETQSGTLRHA